MRINMRILLLVALCLWAAPATDAQNSGSLVPEGLANTLNSTLQNLMPIVEGLGNVVSSLLRGITGVLSQSVQPDQAMEQYSQAIMQFEKMLQQNELTQSIGQNIIPVLDMSEDVVGTLFNMLPMLLGRGGGTS
ncbi:uncharacterized protein LOC100904752 [Galendromus occidentalis]|uniref:Uncharacterized protein LOC100904752 n=1 Tax=Galendromus occidentalis TaxID=34638 RepID=A0AAJ6VWN0_9ACAR|nr:uncharacterized protein LOC100904752 [Galendromus occidentalis]